MRTVSWTEFADKKGIGTGKPIRSEPGGIYQQPPEMARKT